VTLRDDGRWHRGRLVSVRLVDDGRPTVDAIGEAAALVRRLSREDFGASAAVVEPRGRIAAPA
jgi:hypothetical protein